MERNELIQQITKDVMQQLSKQPETQEKPCCGNCAGQQPAIPSAELAQYIDHTLLNLHTVEEDIRAVRRATTGTTILKVIIETCLLKDQEKVLACEIAKKAGADFVKTSTGFSSGGATVEDIALMRRVVGPNLGVKASGGIRDYAKAAAMIQAGATRLGTSASVAIVTGASGSGTY